MNRYLAAKARRTPWRRLATLLLMPPTSLIALPAFGLSLSDDPNLNIRWDNTVKYSNGVRLGTPDPRIEGNTPAFLNNGDRNFSRGSLISNRFDLLSEFDIGTKRYGARLSAAAWYDHVYNSHNDNPGPQVPGAIPFNTFAQNVVDVHGRKAEVLDALVYGNADFSDEISGSLRLGRHSIFWGESLFFGTNGIAGTMTPTDVIKAVSVPGTLFKDLLRKVPQVSGQLSYGSEFTLGGYYQFRWEPTRLPVAGSYFSTQDVTVGRAPQEARDKGQGGLQFKYSPTQTNTDFGAYLTRFHGKTPGGVYLFPAGAAGVQGQAYFHEDSLAFGLSSNTSFGPVNLGLEASTRRNVPLASRAILVTGPAPAGNTKETARYAIGRTAHLQASVNFTLPRLDWIDESGLSAEIAWNRRLSVDRNPGAVDPQADRDSVALQVQYTPVFRQVAQGWDLAVPVGLSYVAGESGALGPGWGADNAGIYSIALNPTYLNTYNFSLRYVGYYGDTGLRGPTGLPAYTQNLRDRRFVTFSVSTAF